MPTAFFALPQSVEDDGIVGFVEQLTRCSSADEIIVDGSVAGSHTAGALVAAASIQRKWQRDGLAVKLLNCQQWPLQKCFEGFSVPRGSLGEGAGVGFTSAIYEVLPSHGEVERIASALAVEIAPDGWAGGPLYPVVQYCFGELLRNCVQHAGQVAYAVVQERCDPLGNVDSVRIAVADCGRGARRSFVENESPETRPDMSDSDAIRHAITPFASSTRYLPQLPYGRSSNMGIGLSMVRQLTRGTRGHFAIVSGNAWLREGGEGSVDEGYYGPEAAWPGCVVSVSLGLNLITSYNDMLAAARDAIGLTRSKIVNKLFP
jgi:hypothetical protein